MALQPGGTDIDRSPYILGPKGIGFIGAQGMGLVSETSLKVVLNWREDLERRSAR